MIFGDYWLAVISHERPNNVAKVSKIAPPATWYIGPTSDERRAYSFCGAPAIASTKSLCDARNKALDDAFYHHKACIQMSDDPSRLVRLDTTPAGDKLTRTKITFQEAVETVHREMKRLGALLGGGAPNDFIAWSWWKTPVMTAAFILGDFMLVAPTHLRFDENLALKEDYDYTLQHLQTYGKVARCNRVMFDFNHRTNAGGAVSRRTRELELKTIDYLKTKWGDRIKPNPRSDTEILLNLS